MLVAGGLLLVAACAHVSNEKYKAATAGLIGCPSSEIEISGQSNIITSTPVEWRAECRGRRYICSGSGNVAHCTEELVASPAGASAKPAP